MCIFSNTRNISCVIFVCWVDDCQVPTSANKRTADELFLSLPAAGSLDILIQIWTKLSLKFNDESKIKLFWYFETDDFFYFLDFLFIVFRHQLYHFCTLICCPHCSTWSLLTCYDYWGKVPKTLQQWMIMYQVNFLLAFFGFLLHSKHHYYS